MYFQFYIPNVIPQDRALALLINVIKEFNVVGTSHLFIHPIVRMYDVLDGSTTYFVSGYFLIASFPTFFPYEGLLKHCIYFITSSSALPFQPLQAVSFALRNWAWV